MTTQSVQMHIESLDLTQETSMMQINHDHFLRMKELANGPHGCGMIGVSAQTIWKWVKQKKFPQPLHLGGKGSNVTVWRSSEIQAWMNAQG